MTITPYLDTTFDVVRPEAGIADVKAILDKMDCVGVVDGNGKPLGLLTCTDMAEGARTVADCSYLKPFLSSGDSLLHASGLMKASVHGILPVVDGGRLTAVLRSNALLPPLAEMVEKYQLLFQHVAHDLRNPIGNINVILSLLEENLVKPENITMVNYGHESCAAALQMLNELLENERKDTVESGFRRCNLSAFTTECIRQLEGVFKPKAIQLELSLTSAGFFANIDAAHLQRVIHNLLSNAVKFSQPQGRITISSEIKNDRFLLMVADEGIGIPFEKQSHVFDRFTTAQQKGTSGEETTGLGLFFSRKTIDEHGGKIWFESEAGKGTRFFIELPGQ